MLLVCYVCTSKYNVCRWNIHTVPVTVVSSIISTRTLADRDDYRSRLASLPQLAVEIRPREPPAHICALLSAFINAKGRPNLVASGNTRVVFATYILDKPDTPGIFRIFSLRSGDPKRTGSTRDCDAYCDEKHVRLLFYRRGNEQRDTCGHYYLS